MSGKILLVNSGNGFSYVYDAGQWDIEFQKPVDKNHPRAKEDSDSSTTTETQGDLNRCIAATPTIYKGMYDVETYGKLRKAYIAALNKFKNFKDIPFEDKHHVDLESLVNDGVYRISTNKNHHGIKLEFNYATDHRLSDSGLASDMLTMPNYEISAERVFGIEVGEFVSVSEALTTDEIIDFMDKSSTYITQTIAEVVDS